MGFPVAWQSRINHDSIVAKQDFQMRLLETIRKTILQRVRCSREYANALTSSISQFGAKVDKPDDFSGKNKSNLSFTK